jgi:hypothetical protein
MRYVQRIKESTGLETEMVGNLSNSEAIKKNYAEILELKSLMTKKIIGD